MVEPDLLGWPQAHVRLALMEEHTGPALASAQNRRGLVVYVAARVVDRPPRGLGRTPGGCLLVMPGAIAGRRSVLQVAGCQGFVGGRTGSGAVMAAVAGAGAVEVTVTAPPPEPPPRRDAAEPPRRAVSGRRRSERPRHAAGGARCRWSPRAA